MWQAYFLIVFTLLMLLFLLICTYPKYYVDIYTGVKYKVLQKGFCININSNYPYQAKYCYVLVNVKDKEDKIVVYSDEINRYFNEVLF